jgi:hypothetical protein
MDPRLTSYFPFWSLLGDRGLFASHPQDRLRHQLVVCWTAAKGADMERRYGVFETVPAFFRFYQALPEEARTGYEVVLGEFPQKPHFDIDNEDPSVPGDLVLQALVDAVLRVAGQQGVDLVVAEDILVYTSHGAGKQSYHVVLPRWCHKDHRQAKAFASAVFEECPPELRNNPHLLDRKVYNPLQQWRLLGSTKVGKGRHKREAVTWLYHGQVVTPPQVAPLEAFARSLLGWTTDCRALPCARLPEPAPAASALPPGALSSAWKAFVDHPSVGRSGALAFKPSIKGDKVLLKRQRPSVCPVCDRTHDHQNAFLDVDNQEIYFRCWQGLIEHKGSLWLGRIE